MNIEKTQILINSIASVVFLILAIIFFCNGKGMSGVLLVIGSSFFGISAYLKSKKSIEKHE